MNNAEKFDIVAKELDSQHATIQVMCEQLIAMQNRIAQLEDSIQQLEAANNDKVRAFGRDFVTM